MEITIKAEPKEIAALVLELQERQEKSKAFCVDGKEVANLVAKATHDTILNAKRNPVRTGKTSIERR